MIDIGQNLILNYSIFLMEGKEDESLLNNIVNESRLQPADILQVTQAAADIYW